MRLRRGTLFNLMREGRITLQIPEIEVNVSENPNQEFSEDNPFPFVLTPCTEDEYEEYPDEWFMYLKYDGVHLRPCVGNESGYLYFSRIGWTANMAEILDAFESSPNQRGSTADFMLHVEEHFLKLENKLQRTIDRERRKLNELVEALAIVRGG